MNQRSSQQFSLTIFSEIKFRREKERHQFFRGENEDESRVRSRESSEKIGKKRESRREKRSGEQRREKAAESHIQTATSNDECISHFCWRHFIFRYWHAPVSFIYFVCFVIIQKFDKTFTLGIPECF